MSFAQTFAPTFAQTFSLLPEPLRERFLFGSCGDLHLAALAEEGLAGLQEDPALSPQCLEQRLALYSDMLLAAWEESPWDVQRAAVLLQLDRVRAFLPPPLRALLTVFTRATPTTPPNTPRNVPDAASLWAGLLATDADHADPEAFAASLTRTSLPTPLRLRVAADARRLCGDPAGAAQAYQAAFDALPLPETCFRLADCLLLLQRREEAAARLGVYLGLRPWSVHGVLRLHDVLLGLDLPGAPPPGRGAALFYTWNRADCLDQALAALVAGDDMAEVPVIALDNGSTDATPDVLRAWKDRLGARLSLHALPVNVGAPAARNWLLSLPETAATDWLAYLDDDALLPPDWLGHFGTAMRAYPEAGIHGCRVADHTRPWQLQSADLHLVGDKAPALRFGQEDADQSRLSAFLVSDLHHQTPDFGTFSHLRPCVSVTGCVHLFKTEALRECGPFNLAFSPSQYDDLEHDLRSARLGSLPVCNGHLRVRHMQGAGSVGRRSAINAERRAPASSPAHNPAHSPAHNLAAAAAPLAHFFTLRLLYPPEDIAAIRALDARVAHRDLLRKENAIRERCQS